VSKDVEVRREVTLAVTQCERGYNIKYFVIMEPCNE
jgi:hypothetical protein